jgi:hypothetical protein
MTAREGNIRLNDEMSPSRLFFVSDDYLTLTERVACPPKLLRTVMLCGLTDTLSCPRNRPPPSLVNVPIS